MTDQHPITPPLELVQQWFDMAVANEDKSSKSWILRLANYAAQWGSDQELEACCEGLKNLRAARRPSPEPPSLKEQALEALDRMDQFPTADDQRIIRRALKALPDD